MAFLRFRTLSASIDEVLHFRQPMEHWFKYTEARWADELVREGKLRIGTLHDYRRREKFGGGRLDEEEGTTAQYVQLEGSHAIGDVPEFAKGMIQELSPSKDVFVENVKYQVTYHAPDTYVLCVSKNFAPAKLLPDFEPADACVEIIAPDKFVAALDSAMKVHGRLLGAHDCIYGNRARQYTEQRIPAIAAKELCYAHQAEVRIGWLPHNLGSPFTDLNPPFMDVVVPDLRKWCRRIV